MEKSNLIFRNEGRYQLTQFGKTLAKTYKPFLDTIEAIEANNYFWNTHDISAIPEKLFDRIGELHKCQVTESKDSDICEPHNEFMENVATSVSFKGVACVFLRDWIYLFSELSNDNIPIEIMVTNEIYEKIKREYATELEKGLENQNAHIYVCNDNLKVSFATTDQFFSLSLNFKNGLGHDRKRDLIGFDSSSIKWGEDLFEYYKKKSIEVPRMLQVNEYVFCKGKRETVELDCV